MERGEGIWSVCWSSLYVGLDGDVFKHRSQGLSGNDGNLVWWRWRWWWRYHWTEGRGDSWFTGITLDMPIRSLEELKTHESWITLFTSIRSTVRLSFYKLLLQEVSECPTTPLDARSPSLLVPSLFYPFYSFHIFPLPLLSSPFESFRRCVVLDFRLLLAIMRFMSPKRLMLEWALGYTELQLFYLAGF